MDKTHFTISIYLSNAPAESIRLFVNQKFVESLVFNSKLEAHVELAQKNIYSENSELEIFLSYDNLFASRLGAIGNIYNTNAIKFDKSKSQVLKLAFSTDDNFRHPILQIIE